MRRAADLCLAVSTQPLDYPFYLANAYSNRRARAGLDPCNSSLYPLNALAVVSTTGVQPAPVDFSSGQAKLSVNVFVANPSTTERVTFVASLGDADNPGFVGIFLGPSLSVHDGDSIPVNLPLTYPQGPASFGFDLTSDLAPGMSHQLITSLCPEDDAGLLQNCASTQDPIIGLPPFVTPDGGLEEESVDGGFEAALQDVAGDAPFTRVLVGANVSPEASIGAEASDEGGE
jgi:hypothetical protein